MKKKAAALIVALLLIICQTTAAFADTWVDDSSFEGGGYWIDDNGNYIQSNEAAPEPVQQLVRGAEEKIITNNNETPTAYSTQGYATSAQISAITSANAAASQMSVTANGNVDFRFTIKGAPATPVYSYDGGILTIMDNQNRYNVFVLGAEGVELASAASIREHSYNVSYNLEGTVVSQASGVLTMGESRSYTAPLMFTYNNLEYVLTDGEKNQTQLINFGISDYQFLYQVYNPTDRTAKVTLVDERDNVLEERTSPVVYRGGDVIFNIPSTYEKDGRSYEKYDNISRVTVNYLSSQLEYTIRYKEKLPTSTQPYSVKVNYVDADTGAVIGGDLFNVSSQNIADDITLSFGIKSELAYYTGTSTVYYKPQQQAPIMHKASDNTTLTYTVPYEKIAEDAPYTWSVRLIDIATGNTLSTVNYNITVSQPATHAVDSQVTVDGEKYLLDSQMQTEYNHSYNDAGRIQYIYYNKEGTAAVTDYSINVFYAEITNNSILYSTRKTVTPSTNQLPIAADANYTGADGTEYVMLQGQENISHSFYSPQRSYTVYYRDVNDVQNADTVITREEVITVTTEVPATATETPATTTPVVPAAATEGTNTVITNNDTGTTEVIPEENSPLADGTGTGTEPEAIPDENAPLADGVDTVKNTIDNADSANANQNSINWILIISIGAVVLAAILVTVLVLRKKAHSNK